MDQSEGSTLAPPHIDRRRVVVARQQQLRRAVPPAQLTGVSACATRMGSGATAHQLTRRWRPEASMHETVQASTGSGSSQIPCRTAALSLWGCVRRVARCMAGSTGREQRLGKGSRHGRRIMRCWRGAPPRDHVLRHEAHLRAAARTHTPATRWLTTALPRASDSDGCHSTGELQMR